MKRHLTLSLFIVVSLSAGGFISYQLWKPAEVIEPGYVLQKQIRYSFELKNTSADFIKESTFKAFAPVRQTASQKVVGLSASLPFELALDEHGNQLMSFTVTALSPYGTKVVVITANLLLSELPNAFSSDEAVYLQDGPGFSLDHQQIVARAETLLRSSALASGKLTTDWVNSHIEYSGFDPKDRGAQYAMENARGDCTEFSYLTASLLRRQGFPSRVIGGFVLGNGDAVLRASDYHDWTELMSEDRWVLADAQKDVFNENYENYIAFRVIEKNALSMSNSHRFLAFDPRLDVMMN
jgi:transglutaminase-like putative cysteine protease